MPKTGKWFDDTMFFFFFLHTGLVKNVRNCNKYNVGTYIFIVQPIREIVRNVLNILSDLESAYIMYPVKISDF